MISLIWNTVQRLRWHIIGWAVGLAYLGSMIVTVARTISNMSEMVERLVSAFPEGLIKFFGGLEGFSTPPGFVNTKFFSQLPLLLGIFAIAAGSGLLVSDEESGVMDLLMGNPISRSRLFLARVLGLLVSTVIILDVGLIATITPLFWVDIDLTAGQLARAFLPVLAQVLFMASLSLLLSMVLPSRRTTVYVAGGYLVAGYFIDGFAHMMSTLEPLAKLTPFYWYQGGKVMTEAIHWTWLSGLFALTLVFLVLAWWRFQRRDLRVGGEGTWRLPAFLSRPLLRLRRAPAGPEARSS